MSSGKNGWRAAVEIRRLSGLDRSGKDKQALGAYLVGSTDPDSIIESLARSRRPDPLDEFVKGPPVSEAE